MADLGLTAYRFSVAWPRVSRRGRGARPGQRAGLDFYRRPRRRAARGAASSPSVTLYHWDLPQELEDAGGWTEPRDRRAVRRVRADRRRRRSATASAAGSRSTSRGARPSSATPAACTRPAAPTPCAALTAAHHLNLAHGLARVAAVRAAAPARAGRRQPQPRVGAPGHRLGRRRRRRPPRRRPGKPGLPRPDPRRRATRPTCSPTPPPSPTGRSSGTATSRRSRRRIDALGLNYYTPDLVRRLDARAAPRERRRPRRQRASPGPARDDVAFHQRRASAPRWAGRSTRRACTTLLHAAARRERPGPAAVGHRERRRLRRHASTPTARSTTRERIAYLRGHLARRARARSPTARTSAATSCGR